MPHLGQQHDLRPLDLLDVPLHVVGEADLVGLPLEGDPRHLEAGAGEEAHPLPLGARPPGEPLPLAQRRLERQVGAEAHADRAAECVRRRLDDRRVGQGGARGVADHDRRDVAREFELLLHVLAQHLEVGGGVVAGLFGGLHRLVEARQVDADDQRVERGEDVRHVHDTQVPAAVAGEEEDDVLGVWRIAVQVHLAKTAVLQRLGGGTRRQRNDTEQRGEEQGEEGKSLFHAHGARSLAKGGPQGRESRARAIRLAVMRWMRGSGPCGRVWPRRGRT